MALKVLIVEDDPDDLFLIKEYLSQDKINNYTYETCPSLAHAIAYVEKKYFDIILLDLGLPDAEGMEALEILAKRESAGPIIVLTINDDEFGQHAIKMGAADYLPKKHTDCITLSRSIRHAIERHNLLLQLKQKAETDPLTGLANRAMFYDKLDFMVAQSERSGRPFALVMIDFDKFKEINDTKGHLYGDQLLKAFSTRLKEVTRRSDYPARFGGDEFLIIVSNFQDKEDLKRLVKVKQAELSQQYELELGGKTYRQSVEMSIGIMLWEPGFNAQMMLGKADEAMYRTKKNSSVSIEMYN